MENQLNSQKSKIVPVFLAGVMVGGAIVYGYSNLNGRKTSVKNDLTAGICSVDYQDGAVAAYLKFKAIKNSAIPSGVPAIYGSRLNVSFEQAQDAINKVAPYDPTYGKQKIILEGGDLDRYIKIGSLTACQYCCGAETLVQENGEPACGCEHSQMMRGLIAYLIKNNPEMPDEQILSETNRWKSVFFPKQTLTAKLQELEQAGDKDIKTILEEFPDFLPQMVGGC